jgi:hypothetical protein
MVKMTDTPTPQPSLREVLSDLGSTLFCKGQDWKKGDGSDSEVEVVCGQAEQVILALVAAAKPGKFVADTTAVHPMYRDGYNQALDAYEAALLAALQGAKA